MINNYRVIKDANIGKIETLYEDWESSFIRRCDCECYLPKKDCKVDYVHCKFEDKQGNLVFDLELPNYLMYSLYNNQLGVVITNDDKAILRGWEKSETTCYSLKTNEVLWKSNISKVSEIFVYKSKVYAYCSTSKDELYLLSLDTGKVIKKILYHKSDLDSLHIYRLSERYLVAYYMGFIFIYDMLKEELRMSSLLVKQPSQYFWLHKVMPNGENEVIFRYKELNCNKGEIDYTDQDFKIEDIVLNSEKCDFHKTIPTKYEEIEKEYKRLFE